MTLRKYQETLTLRICLQCHFLCPPSRLTHLLSWLLLFSFVNSGLLRMSPARTTSYPGHWLSLTTSKMFQGTKCPYLDYGALSPFSTVLALCSIPKYHAGQGGCQTTPASQLLTSSVTLLVCTCCDAPFLIQDSPAPPPARKSSAICHGHPRSFCIKVYGKSWFSHTYFEVTALS